MADDAKVYVLKSGPRYWNGQRWHPCLRCAARFTRDEAHKIAHRDNSEGWAAVRVRPKAPAQQATVEEMTQVPTEHKGDPK